MIPLGMQILLKQVVAQRRFYCTYDTCVVRAEKISQTSASNVDIDVVSLCRQCGRAKKGKKRNITQNVVFFHLRPLCKQVFGFQKRSKSFTLCCLMAISDRVFFLKFPSLLFLRTLSSSSLISLSTSATCSPPSEAAFSIVSSVLDFILKRCN